MKAQSVLNKILTELAQIRKVEFAQMALENGTILEAEEFAPENEVFILSGEERIPAPVGEHKLEDGKILVIIEEGIIAEIKEEEAPASEEVEMQSEEAIAVLILRRSNSCEVVTSPPTTYARIGCRFCLPTLAAS